MKSMFRKIIFNLAVLSCVWVGSSCKEVFDLDPEEALTSQQMYRDIFDADAAIIGLYGKFSTLAKQYVVLNELRADLLDVTDNADVALREINNHNVTESNAYANPRPYYELILNCNDILKNFKMMVETNKIKRTEYNQRYADVIALRSWIYLQLAIHYNSVPYITESIEKIGDVSAIASKPAIPLKEMIKQLITDMETIPSVYLDPYTLDNTFVSNNVDGYSPTTFFINKTILLGDLYLWDNQFTKAATMYKYIMTTSDRLGFEATDINVWYHLYKITRGQISSGMGPIAVSYDANINDENRLLDNNSTGWRSIFARDRSNTTYNGLSNTSNISRDPEWLWLLPFDNKFLPENPFVELFSNVGGKYLLQPSQQVQDMWNSQTQTNNFNFDARGKMSYKTVNGKPVVYKYLYNYLNPNLTGSVISLVGKSLQEKNGRWFLNRAANVHLKFAEAANREGRRKLAFALLNSGVASVYNGTSTDKTNLMNTFDVPPFDFDARNGDAPVRYRSSWHLATGIRGRAMLKNTEVVGDSTIAIENSIIQEGALELAFEGHRWGDLVRVALRREDPTFLADKVYDKLRKANNPNAAAVRSKLMNKENWFLPFKLQ